MREKVYNKLSRAQEATEARSWSEALKALADLEKMTDLDAYEKAQLYTAYGYLYFTRERYLESIGAYETVLVQEGLPEAVMMSTLYTLAQLRFQVGDYGKAVRDLEQWLVTANNPGPEPHFLRAQAYYQLERYREAIDPLNRAIATARERGQSPRKEWYALRRALYHKLEDYQGLLETLEILVTDFPSKEYWIHLAATYGEIGDSRRQLAVYEAAFAQGYLVTGAELVLLSQLLLRADIPYRAGIILEEGIENGTIDGTAENWRLLSQAWTLAREDVKAVTSLQQAARLSDDGELDARLAQSHANLGEWQQAVDAARVALRKGVNKDHQMHILLGMALFELGRYDEARGEFRAVHKHAEARDTAVRWLLHIDREEERLREIENSLN